MRNKYRIVIVQDCAGKVQCPGIEWVWLDVWIHVNEWVWLDVWIHVKNEWVLLDVWIHVNEWVLLDVWIHVNEWVLLDVWIHVNEWVWLDVWIHVNEWVGTWYVNFSLFTPALLPSWSQVKYILGSSIGTVLIFYLHILITYTNTHSFNRIFRTYRSLTDNQIGRTPN